MAQQEHMTVNELEFTKGRDSAGSVTLRAANSSDGTATIEILSDQLVEVVGAFTASHKLKVKINGVEFWMALDAV